MWANFFLYVILFRRLFGQYVEEQFAELVEVGDGAAVEEAMVYASPGGTSAAAPPAV